MNKLQEAISTVRANMGLTSPPSEWTYEQRVAYNKALADYINQAPQAYDDQTQATAAVIASTQYSPLEDDGFLADVSAFGSAVGDEVINAGQSVAGVGQGVLTSFKMASWLIPLALLVAVGIILWGFFKKQTA